MVSLSVNLKLGDFGLRCAQQSWRFYQGGNFWSGWTCFLSFFKNVVGLDIDYSKYVHYEKANIHGSWRFMHEKFCIISDRPSKLTVDEENRPHSYQGPYIEWRDGTALYAIHGVRVPMWIAETKAEEFTKDMILSEENADYRRCIVQKIGIEKTVELLGAEVIDTYESSVGGQYELLAIDYTGTGEKRPFLKMKNPSMDAWHIEGVSPGIKTVKDAICFRNGLKKFIEPEVLS